MLFTQDCSGKALGTTGRSQTMALALAGTGADCFKHPEVLSALGDRMLKHLLRSQLLYSPALELPWESGLHGREKEIQRKMRIFRVH